jgi:hypothetical protein
MGVLISNQNGWAADLAIRNWELQKPTQAQWPCFASHIACALKETYYRLLAACQQQLFVLIE